MKNILFGSMVWGGEYKGMPAVVGSYYNGASLYVFCNGEWSEYARGESESDVIPKKCRSCGQDLPVFNKNKEI